jgi:hypothetical protein
MGDSRTPSKLRLTISNIPIKPCQNGRSGGVTCLCVFPVGGEGRRFFLGILISPRFNQERNSIPDEFLKFG